MKNFLCMIGVHDWNYRGSFRECDNCSRKEEKVRVANSFIKTTSWLTESEIENRAA